MQKPIQEGLSEKKTQVPIKSICVYKDQTFDTCQLDCGISEFKKKVLLPLNIFLSSFPNTYTMEKAPESLL